MKANIIRKLSVHRLPGCVYNSKLSNMLSAKYVISSLYLFRKSFNFNRIYLVEPIGMVSMGERTVKKIDVATFASILGAISALAGLITGLIVAVLSSEISSLFPNLTERTIILDVLLGESAILIFPILSFMWGFLEGLVAAVIYNYLAPRIGGIKLSVE